MMALKQSGFETRVDKAIVRGKGQFVFLLAGCIGSGLVCLRLYFTNESAAAELILAREANLIEQLHQRPMTVIETETSDERFMDDITASMKRSGLESSALVSTLPQTSRRLAKTGLTVRSHQLVFEKVGLEALIRFTFQLKTMRKALVVTSLNLRPESQGLLWSAEVEVAQISSIQESGQE
jgi:hypothetical protein